MTHFIKQDIPADFGDEASVGYTEPLEEGQRAVFVSAISPADETQGAHALYFSEAKPLDDLIAALQRARRDVFGPKA